MTKYEEAARARASSKKLTNAKAAAKLRARAEAEYRRSQKRWASDPYMLDMIESDFIALKRIASDIRAGDLAGAYHHAGHLDTAVREEIPLDVWMYIGGRGLHE